MILMITPEEKYEFVTDYITSYENKIKLKNSLGLFDAATMFENFATKICQLWFSKDFQNSLESLHRSGEPYGRRRGFPVEESVPNPG